MAQAERKEPLSFEHVHVESVSGETGQQLEKLYVAYFAVQASLAGDEKITKEKATRLNKVALTLNDSADLPEAVRKEMKFIAEKSEHLHHMTIEKARLDAFRPISHAVVRLASLVRSEGATESFSQMFCPMVKGGGGDWLQPNDDLQNPYFGSKMLTCGDVVRQFQAKGTAPEVEATTDELR